MPKWGVAVYCLILELRYKEMPYTFVICHHPSSMWMTSRGELCPPIDGLDRGAFHLPVPSPFSPISSSSSLISHSPEGRRTIALASSLLVCCNFSRTCTKKPSMTRFCGRASAPHIGHRNASGWHGSSARVLLRVSRNYPDQSTHYVDSESRVLVPRRSVPRMGP